MKALEWNTYGVGQPHYVLGESMCDIFNNGVALNTGAIAENAPDFEDPDLELYLLPSMPLITLAGASPEFEGDLGLMYCIKANASTSSASCSCMQGFRGDPESYKNTPAGMYAAGIYRLSTGEKIAEVWQDSTQAYPLNEKPVFTAASETTTILFKLFNVQVEMLIATDENYELDPDLAGAIQTFLTGYIMILITLILTLIGCLVFSSQAAKVSP